MTLTAIFLGLAGSNHRGHGSVSSQFSRYQDDDQSGGRSRPMATRPHSQIGQGKKLSKDEALYFYCCCCCAFVVAVALWFIIKTQV